MSDATTVLPFKRLNSAPSTPGKTRDQRTDGQKFSAQAPKKSIEVAGQHAKLQPMIERIRETTPPPPHAAKLAMELRAPWELGSSLATWPVLKRCPQGDGHAVIVYPGLTAGDASTLPLRHFLGLRNYHVQGWGQGLNLGPRHGVLERAKAQLVGTFERSGQAVSLVGWSLGGLYARELAKVLPKMVRCVITLGTPFAGSPKSTRAWRIYELASGRKAHLEAAHFDLSLAPPVPMTSIFSRSDGVVAWQACLQAPSAQNHETENIEVRASHFGIGMNPCSIWAVADRLSLPSGTWKPFTASRFHLLHRLIYPDPDR